MSAVTSRGAATIPRIISSAPATPAAAPRLAHPTVIASHHRQPQRAPSIRIRRYARAGVAIRVRVLTRHDRIVSLAHVVTVWIVDGIVQTSTLAPRERTANDEPGHRRDVAELQQIAGDEE